MWSVFVRGISRTHLYNIISSKGEWEIIGLLWVLFCYKINPNLLGIQIKNLFLKSSIYHLSKTVFSSAVLQCIEVDVEEQGPAIVVQNNYIKNIITVKWISVDSKTVTNIGELISTCELIVFSSG